MEINKYTLSRDVDIIAKFISRITAWELAYEIYKANNTAKLPRHIGKDAKWPAYEAAGRIERMLGLEIGAHSVPDLAKVLGAGIEAYNRI